VRQQQPRQQHRCSEVRVDFLLDCIWCDGSRVQEAEGLLDACVEENGVDIRVVGDDCGDFGGEGRELSDVELVS
jgi:hypothetical protein